MSGRVLISVSVRTRPCSILPRSTIGVSPVTVIVSAIAPTVSFTLRTAVRPAECHAGLLELAKSLQLGGHTIRAERQQQRTIDRFRW